MAPPKNCVRQSVDASLKDGAFWALMTGFVEPYIVPFALALGASTLGIGFLRSVPALLGSLFLIFNERFVARLGSCRKAVFVNVFTQALAAGAGALSAFLPAPYGLLFFIAAVTVYTLSGAMSNPPWAALMGEYLPASRRGEFFGFRYQLVGLTFFAAGFAASAVLAVSAPAPAAYGKSPLTGFVLIFALAGLFRLGSAYYITRMYEPRTGFHLPKTVPASFWSIFDFDSVRLRAMFLLTFVLLGAAFLTAPYFSVYVLKELHYGYLKYTFLVTVGPLMTYLFMKRWGRLADAFGSVKVLRLSFLLIPTVPLFWAVSRNFIYLSLVEVYSGVIWGAYLIGINNFLYDAAGAALRTRANACFGFISGLAQFGGAMLGGWLYEVLPAWHGSPFIILLIISGVLRFFAFSLFLRLVKEDHKSKPAPDYQLALFLLGLKPING
ncbi:MAG: MFS transporter [Elusimicrobia bacterium]|nr:MFS transporter [Elusimicrobiota bacterium]